jgi:hypothetical protein
VIAGRLKSRSSKRIGVSSIKFNVQIQLMCRSNSSVL